MTKRQQTEPISVHKLRRSARKVERELTAELEDPAASPPIPSWVKGYRVRKVGLFQFVVEATSWRGH